MTPKPESVDWQREAEWHQWTMHTGTEVQFANLPGVFAKNGLDPATQLLLENLPTAPLSGRCLDMGCGSGVIGAAVALRAHQANSPLAGLVLADAYALALRATELTLAANNLAGEVLASDVFGNVEGPFDWILSNPPFHQGVAEDFDVAQRLISEAPGYLNPAGNLILVANRHLPYRKWMRKSFRQVNSVAETPAFMVLHGRNS